jgi:hypothetical protein
MTTEALKDGTRFNCDSGGCHKNYESNERNWTVAWSEARAYGWVAATYFGEWHHYCPTCKKELGDD